MSENKPDQPGPGETWLTPRKRVAPAGLSALEQTAFKTQRDLEQAIRKIVSTEGVDEVGVTAYYNFGRQVLRQTGKARPTAEDLAALVRKWTAQGAREHILVRILTELFKLDYSAGVNSLQSARRDKKAWS